MVSRAVAREIPIRFELGSIVRTDTAGGRRPHEGEIGGRGAGRSPPPAHLRPPLPPSLPSTRYAMRSAHDASLRHCNGKLSFPYKSYVFHSDVADDLRKRILNAKLF